MAHAATSPAGVARSPLIFGAAGAQLFGWLHEPGGGARDLAVLVCGAIGIEYVNAHRALRHLADALAARGYATLRFDYPGVGDSAQDETDPGRVGQWSDAVVAAAAALREFSGCTRIAAVGLRFGGALAGVAASRAGIDELVLWNTVSSGRRYTREMRAVAALAGYKVESCPGQLESAGFVYTDETLRDIQAVDLLAQPFAGVRRALVVERDDLRGDERLTEHLRSCGVDTTTQRQPGYERMVCESLFTEVPQAAIDAIGDWLDAGSATARHALPPRPRLADAIELDDAIERPLRVGAQGLFGVLCAPRGGARGALLVMLNSGVDHHVGPGRLYVKLARALAAEGYASVRLDIGGVGDSAPIGDADRNLPYPARAVDELVAALPELVAAAGARRLVLTGICAGAYHAFTVAQRELDVDLAEVILLNPVQFEPEASAAQAGGSDSSAEVAAFERRQRRRKFAHAIPGSAPVVGLLRFVRDRLHRGQLRAAGLLQRGADEGDTAACLLRIHRQGTRLALFVSPADPGFELLQLEAGDATRAGLRDGWISVEVIADADHVFSSEAARLRLRAGLLERLRRLG